MTASSIWGFSLRRPSVLSSIGESPGPFSLLDLKAFVKLGTGTGAGILDEVVLIGSAFGCMSSDFLETAFVLKCNDWSFSSPCSTLFSTGRHDFSIALAAKSFALIC